MIGYVFIGIFAVIFIYIMALYFINSRKIKKKNTPKVEKTEEKVEKDKNEKVEVASEISSGSPLEKAINEANDYSKNTEIEQAFKQIEAQREAFEKSNPGVQKYRGLRKDRENFKTELQMAMETNRMAMETSRMAMESNRISSETNVIGKEGPSQAQIDKTNLEIELENQKQESRETTIAKEINKMSPEAKAILINDILGKKY